MEIVKIREEGDHEEGRETKTINNLHTQEKKRAIVTAEKQLFVDQRMEEIIAIYPRLLIGVGRAQIDSIHISIDKQVKPVQKKQQKVALHFMGRLKAHIEELKANNMISGPLHSNDTTRWISNPVITGEKVGFSPN